jgi:hypothetical protein
LFFLSITRLHRRMVEVKAAEIEAVRMRVRARLEA